MSATRTEPIRVHRGHLRHVLLRSQDQLVVDHVRRRICACDGASVSVSSTGTSQATIRRSHPSPYSALVGCRCVGRPERMFTNSPMPFTRAAWWKYPDAIAFLHTRTVSASVRARDRQRRTAGGRARDVPDHVKVRSGRDDVHLLELHDVLELHAHLPRLLQQLRVQEVPQAPVVAVPRRGRPINSCAAQRRQARLLTRGSSTG